jgi:hypothetical protein
LLHTNKHRQHHFQGSKHTREAGHMWCTPTPFKGSHTELCEIIHATQLHMPDRMQFGASGTWFEVYGDV